MIQSILRQILLINHHLETLIIQLFWGLLPVLLDAAIYLNFTLSGATAYLSSTTKYLGKTVLTLHETGVYFMIIFLNRFTNTRKDCHSCTSDSRDYRAFRNTVYTVSFVMLCNGASSGRPQQAMFNFENRPMRLL